MKKLTITLVLLASTSTFAAETTATTTTETKTVTATQSTPKETCMALVKAAQEQNFEAFTQLSRAGGKGMGPGNKAGSKNKMKPGFDKMHTNELEKLKTLNCGAEYIADTRAFVETDSAGKTRFVPFVKEGKDWKFDTKTYMSFYETGMMTGKKKK